MKENGRMNWLAQIRQMKNRDIRTIEQSELQELQLAIQIIIEITNQGQWIR